MLQSRAREGPGLTRPSRVCTVPALWRPWALAPLAPRVRSRAAVAAPGRPRPHTPLSRPQLRRMQEMIARMQAQMQLQLQGGDGDSGVHGHHV